MTKPGVTLTVLAALVLATVVVLALGGAFDGAAVDGGGGGDDPRVAGGPAAPEGGASDPENPPEKKPLMTEIDPKVVEAVGVESDVAVDSARKALKALEGKVNVPSDATVLVQREDGKHVTTFKITLPPGVRGGDYAAKVTLDASTGEVLSILAGS